MVGFLSVNKQRCENAQKMNRKDKRNRGKKQWSITPKIVILNSYPMVLDGLEILQGLYLLEYKCSMS